jgi:hypothetical protein
MSHPDPRASGHESSDEDQPKRSGMEKPVDEFQQIKPDLS